MSSNDHISKLQNVNCHNENLKTILQEDFSRKRN
jgi:hypothetical protein